MEFIPLCILMSVLVVEPSTCATSLHVSVWFEKFCGAHGGALGWMSIMDYPKSQAELMLGLCTRMVGCDPLSLSTPSQIRRDLKYVKLRFENESVSFLTKLLPRLGKALDDGMIDGRFKVPHTFQKASKKYPNTPAFLSVYFKRVFDGNTGDLLDDADPGAVLHLRQILYSCYKAELPYTPEQESAVVDSFIETDQNLSFSDEGETALVLDAGSYIIRDILEGFDPKDIVPRHGPGAVSTGEKLEDKWEFSRLFNSIHQFYPYYEYFVAGGASELSDRLDWYKSLERLESGVAKVVLVPKDSRGPRLISCEPLEYQWIQQGLGRSLMRHLEAKRPTRGKVNFTHQEINQRLALRGSLSGKWATLDLKDASDRVSLQLVRRLFSQSPIVLRALEATRSSATRLPNGNVMTLAKFAPMGSALCFPVEALCFWVIIVAAISRANKMRPTDVGRRVYVYGDDIVVPTKWALQSIQALESVGLLVNRSKSCIKGPFRESCGIDAFKGVVVTPARVRKPWTGRRSDGTAYASYIALANSLSQRGYEEASQFLWAVLERTYGKIPYGTSLASYPCKLVQCPSLAVIKNRALFSFRWSSNHQRVEFRVPLTKSKKLGSTLDGWTRMLRNIVSFRSDDPFAIVVPRSMKIKRGWAPVH